MVVCNTMLLSTTYANTTPKSWYPGYDFAVFKVILLGMDLDTMPIWAISIVNPRFVIMRVNTWLRYYINLFSGKKNIGDIFIPKNMKIIIDYAVIGG